LDGSAADADSDARTDANTDANDADRDSVSGLCVRFEEAVAVGTVESEELGEISGIVASRANPGVLWVHNDSGDSARVFAIEETGRTLGVFQLDGVTAYDWEDIAIARGEPNDVIYVGDIGDNNRNRTGITIHRFTEPEVDREGPSVSGTIDAVESFDLAYGDAVSHDAEAFVIDHVTGDLYILTKELSGTTIVFRAVAPLESGRTITLEQVAEVALSAMIPMVTAADVSPRGDGVLVRFYSDVMLWVRPDGGPFASAFDSPPHVLPRAAERQGESISWGHDGTGYYTISEGTGPAVNYFAASEECSD